eukprot:7736904-Pyramimonas_sp.AAC.1
MDTAAHADEGARTRQSVRNIPRQSPATALDLDKEYLKNVLVTEKLHIPRLDHREKREVSEWLTTALRQKPFHHGKLSDRFISEVTSYDEYDGWADLSQLLNTWSAEGCECHHHKHLYT